MAQWLSLATGATAALTGVYGDRRLAEPPFDSIFREARLHGLSSFATGSPWFTEIYHSQLLKSERFYAEGAVPPPSAVPSGIAHDGVSERVAPGSHWTLLSAGVGAGDVASLLVEWMGAVLEDEELERE